LYFYIVGLLAVIQDVKVQKIMA